MKKGERVFDWAKARRQLARAIEATEASLVASPERAGEILETRARLLARVPEAPRRKASSLEIVAFTLGSERYAVETRFAREVLRSAKLAPLPEVPDFVAGVVNLRGAVLVVFDLASFFGLPSRDHPEPEMARVVILGRERPEFGVLAAETQGIVEIAIEELHEPTGTVAGIGRDFVKGTTGDAQVILNGAALLGDERLFVGPRVDGKEE